MPAFGYSGDDLKDLAEGRLDYAAHARPDAKPAEGRVGGVLRGGHVVGGEFVYHSPERVRVPVASVRDLRILEGE